MTDIDFGAMNIDNHPNTPTQFGGQSPFQKRGGLVFKIGVRGIPTTILVVNGELKATKVGMTSQTDLEDWLKENI